jgi:hypothetical protein
MLLKTTPSFSGFIFFDGCVSNSSGISSSATLRRIYVADRWRTADRSGEGREERGE